MDVIPYRCECSGKTTLTVFVDQCGPRTFFKTADNLPFCNSKSFHSCGGEVNQLYFFFNQRKIFCECKRAALQLYRSSFHAPAGCGGLGPRSRSRCLYRIQSCFGRRGRTTSSAKIDNKAVWWKQASQGPASRSGPKTRFSSVIHKGKKSAFLFPTELGALCCQLWQGNIFRVKKRRNP